jgi:hypothetical protein
MKMMRKWRTGVFWEWEEMKSAEQWCFNIGKKVASVHQQCFSIMKISSVAQWCFSIVKISSASQRCFSIVKVSSAAQRCFSIVKACLFEKKSASPVL